MGETERERCGTDLDKWLQVSTEILDVSLSAIRLEIDDDLKSGQTGHFTFFGLVFVLKKHVG